MAQWVKDPVWSLQWLESLCGVGLIPGQELPHAVGTAKKKKKKKTKKQKMKCLPEVEGWANWMKVGDTDLPS